MRSYDKSSKQKPRDVKANSFYASPCLMQGLWNKFCMPMCGVCCLAKLGLHKINNLVCSSFFSFTGKLVCRKFPVDTGEFWSVEEIAILKYTRKWAQNNTENAILKYRSIVNSSILIRVLHSCKNRSFQTIGYSDYGKRIERDHTIKLILNPTTVLHTKLSWSRDREAR